MPSVRTWISVRKQIVLPAGLAILLLCLLLGRGLIMRAFHVVQRPLVAVSTWISNGYFSRGNACTLTPEAYETLITERNTFAKDAAEFAALQKENAILKEELGFLQKRQANAVTVSIIGRSTSTQRATFVIDAGSDQHVVEGAAVMVENGLFVGKVTRVDKTQSVVTASTDSELATGVSLLNKSRTIGIAQGASGNLIKIQFIPVDEQIRENDLVVTSGLEDRVPSGLVVGIVNAVKQEVEAPFQYAIVQPLADIRRYDHVIVLLPSL